MDFLNTLGEKIKDTSKSVADKAKEMSEVSKLNAKISATENKLNRAYLEIGKLYCDKYSGEMLEEFQPHLEVINNTIVELDDMKRQVRSLKGYRNCQNCGASIGQNDIFCRACGAKNEIIEEQVVDVHKVKEKVCPICKAVVSEDSEYCNTCGEKLK